jgi:superfamily II DNA or RNA helicase
MNRLYNVVSTSPDLVRSPTLREAACSAELEKISAGHVEQRISERAPKAGEDVAKVRKSLRKLKLVRGRTYHVPVHGGYAVVGDVGKYRQRHVVKTVLGPHMRPPGERLQVPGMRKAAEAKGHWRTLPPGHDGQDEAGNPIKGKTWVRYGLKKNVKLKVHQQDFSDMVSKDPDKGYIAAHGTGTGKTVTSIATFERLKSEGKAGRALVIAPAGLRQNFAGGVGTFTHSKAVIVGRPDQAVSPDTNYVLVSYAAFRRNPDAFLAAYKPDTIIADEFHKASNPDGATYKSIMYARKKVPNFIGLTASIVQNKNDEIAPVVQLASGGKAPIQTKKQFNRRHTERVEAKTRGVFGGKVTEQRIKDKPGLYNSIGGHVHYIEDLDATEKPPKEIQDVSVPMSKTQHKLYSLAMRGVDPATQKKISLGQMLSKKETMNVFTRLMRARQVSNSLHTVDPNMPLAQAAEQTPKIKRVMDDAQKHLQATSDGKIVIYTNLVKGGVDVISAGLTARGIDHGIFAGKSGKGMTEKSRQQAVEDYKSGDKKVIIITSAGAEGLNLPNTTMVMLADGHYNPERMNQAMARGVRAGGQAHRPQAERKVVVRRYVSSIPRSFWQKMTFRDQDKKSVGQWVYRTADRKARSTRELRDVLQQRHTHEQKKRDSRAYRWFGGGP